MRRRRDQRDDQQQRDRDTVLPDRQDLSIGLVRGRVDLNDWGTCKIAERVRCAAGALDHIRRRHEESGEREDQAEGQK